MSHSRHSFTMLVLLATVSAACAQEDYFEAEFHRHGIEERKTPPPEHPEQTGEWKTLHVLMPINPVHMALMHDGRVLAVAGSGSTRDSSSLHAAVYEPLSQNVTTLSLEYDMFCSGMVVLPDGHPFVMGGTMQYADKEGEPKKNWLGLPYTSAFSPSSGTFTATATMSGGRWYPTGTVLGDGRVMVTSGLLERFGIEKGVINREVQIYDPATDRWADAATGPLLPLYPRQTLLPTGQVFISGASATSRFFDPKTFAWREGPKTNYGEARNYGTSVLLPLTPANGFKPTVMILGGGRDDGKDVTKTTAASSGSPHPTRRRSSRWC
jgi:hypothetical protein